MKKITLLLACFFAFQAYAQVTVKPGIRGGINISNFTNTDFDSKTDFYVGGLLAIKFSRVYTLQPEITYSRQGAKAGSINDFRSETDNPEFLSGERNISVQYLSFSTMNRFDIVQGFHATVGPTLDFKVGDNFADLSPELDNDLTGIDLAFMTGLGYTLPNGLTIEARYKIGIVNIFESYYDYEYEHHYDDNGNYDELILNSVIQLGVSYSF